MPHAALRIRSIPGGCSVTLVGQKLNAPRTPVKSWRGTCHPLHLGRPAGDSASYPYYSFRGDRGQQRRLFTGHSLDLCEVGEAAQGLLDTVLEQGGHAIALCRLEYVCGTGFRLDKSFDLIGIDKQLVNTHAALIARIVALWAARATIEQKVWRIGDPQGGKGVGTVGIPQFMKGLFRGVVRLFAGATECSAPGAAPAPRARRRQS